MCGQSKGRNLLVSSSHNLLSPTPTQANASSIANRKRQTFGRSLAVVTLLLVCSIIKIGLLVHCADSCKYLHFDDHSHFTLYLSIYLSISLSLSHLWHIASNAIALSDSLSLSAQIYVSDGLPFSRPNYRILVNEADLRPPSQRQPNFVVSSVQPQGQPSLADLYEFVSQQDPTRAKLYNDLSRARDLIDAQLAAESSATDQQTGLGERDQQQQVRYAIDNGAYDYAGPYRPTVSSPSVSAAHSIDGPFAAVATSAANSPFSQSDLSSGNNEVNHLNAPLYDWSQYSDPKLLYRLAALNSDQTTSTPLTGFGRASSDGPSGALETEPQVIRVEEKRRTSDDNDLIGEETDNHQVKSTPKLATLLEDDESINGTTVIPNDSHESGRNDLNSSTRVGSSEFGHVVYGGASTATTTGDKQAADSSAKTGSTSIFKRMYTKLASYLPFLQQLSILNHPTVTSSKASSGADNGNSLGGGLINSTNPAPESVATTATTTTNVSAPSHDTKQHFSDGNIKNQDTGNLRIDGTNSKRQSSPSSPSASDELQDGYNKQQVVDESALQESARNPKTDENNDNDELSHNRNKVINNDSDQEDNYEGGSIRLSKKQKQLQQQNDNELEDSAIKPQPTKVNLFRQSNLILPLDDDMVVHASIKKNPNLADNFEGKYIYAPTQHYYLGNLGASTGADNAPDESQIRRAFVATPTVGYSHHFQPGDRIQNSYETTVSELRNNAADISSPAFGSNSYTQHKVGSPLGLVDSSQHHRSTNDAYFLVMVGAFCVMAVAMVLSAGMFAYRLQQNRKSNTDTDYPTYGVVGPNNACAILNGGTGKCGATSFVGGYFGGGSEPGSSRGSLYASKTGSAKHLPDLYGSDSGVDKSSLSAITGVAGAGNKKGSSGADSQASLANSSAANQGANQSMAGMTGGFVVNQDAARMYHYQHQKQQMIQTADHRKCGALAGASGVASGRHASASDLDSEDENEDGSYTVYECPGLASAHEMEIKNPLFNDDQSP